MGNIVVKSTTWHIDVDPGSGEVHTKIKGPKGAVGDQGPPGPPNTGGFADDAELGTAFAGYDARITDLESDDPPHNIIFANGFENYPGYSPGVYRFYRKMTCLDGLIRRPTGISLPIPMFVLPENYAPAMAVNFGVLSTTGIAWISIISDGQVSLVEGSTDWVQLFGIKFGPAIFD